MELAMSIPMTRPDGKIYVVSSVVFVEPCVFHALMFLSLVFQNLCQELELNIGINENVEH